MRKTNKEKIVKRIVKEIKEEIRDLKRERGARSGKKEPKMKALPGISPKEMEERKTISLIEEVIIKGSKKEKRVKAKVDTGASRSSIETALLEEIGATPVIRKVLVTSPHLKEVRPLIRLKVKFNNKWVDSTFTVTSRKSMQYKVLLGKNTLEKLNVLIDPSKL